MSRKTTVKRWSMRLLASFLVVLTVSIGFAPLTGRVEAASSKVTQAQKKLKGIQDQLAATKSDRNKLANRQKKLTGELAYLENRSKEQRKVYDEALEQKELALETMVMYQQSYACALQDLDDKVAQYESESLVCTNGIRSPSLDVDPSDDLVSLRRCVL